jgi:hypothetical protein
MRKLFKEKSFQLLLLMGLAIAVFSCSPDPCEECINYTFNGETSTVCYEIDCDLLYY